MAVMSHLLPQTVRLGNLPANAWTLWNKRSISKSRGKSFTPALVRFMDSSRRLYGPVPKICIRFQYLFSPLRGFSL